MTLAEPGGTDSQYLFLSSEQASAKGESNLMSSDARI